MAIFQLELFYLMSPCGEIKSDFIKVKYGAMNLNPVILAIPMYFTLMAIELVYESMTNRKTYRLNDAITNISTGVLSQLTGTFLKIIKIGIYTYCFELLAWSRIEPTWTSFWVLFVLWDLCYYWEHRVAHEVSLFWGGHSVHHQSEDYNLSVALRQSSTSLIWGFPFYLPLAFMGFDPVQFVLVGGLNLLYQFWIHTEHIDKLPKWFEWLFNTPSHHRVHHGRNPKYIDKNYGGIFIIWDRIFGTFQQEEERPAYGITKPLNSWNPVYANVAHYVDLFGAVKQAHNWKDRLRILFNRPGWMPSYLGGAQQPAEPALDYRKYNTSTIAQINVYIFIQFLVALGVNSFFFFGNSAFSFNEKVVFAIWIIVTTLMFGFLFESNDRIVRWLEYLRLAMVPIGIWWFGQEAVAENALALGILLGVTYVVVSAVSFSRLISKKRTA